jgi:hypothetical protein
VFARSVASASGEKHDFCFGLGQRGEAEQEKEGSTHGEVGGRRMNL